MQSQPEAEAARLQRIIQLKDEQIRLLNFRIFGPKTDQLSSAQMPLLLAEVSLTTGEVDQEAGRPEGQKHHPLPRAQQPRCAHPGREPLPASLERREEINPCCPEDCRCPKCGGERPVIGYPDTFDYGPVMWRMDSWKERPSTRMKKSGRRTLTS
ncbi:MAG: transposase domain-containing protein [Limisphaerales bacterium]